jgi:hypothetical protein
VGLVTDDKFAEFLRQAARDYNVPPEPPREEMWEAIAEARAARRRAPGTPITPLRRVKVWLRTGAAIAAILLIGVAIGRFSAKDPQMLGDRQSSARASGGDSRQGLSDSAPGTGARVVATAPPAAESSAMRSGHPLSAGGTRAADRYALRRPSGEAGEGMARSGGTYRAATLQHLMQAEVLLTSFRAESQSGVVDTQVASWARDLLSTTRLLIDSPAAADPQLRRLLDDLEIVLAQIAQLPTQRARGERGEIDLIDEAVEQRDVIARLRTALPAGRRSSGT